MARQPKRGRQRAEASSLAKVAIQVLKPELAAVLGAERLVVEIKTTAAM